MGRVVYVRHGAVDPDPNTPSSTWSLNAAGRAGIAALAPLLGPLPGSVWASAEAKARETAEILTKAGDMIPAVLAELGETAHAGFLSREAFDAAITRFFAQPADPPECWESALDAQARGVAALRHICAMAPAGDVWVVGHGRMGALMNAAVSSRPISRGLWPRDFGAWFSFDRESWALMQDWQAPQ